MSNGFRVPDSYFEELTKQIDTGQPVDNNVYDNLFADLTEDIDPGGGTAWDFFGNFAWGTASGVTWGATELARTSKDWEEMTSSGKAGWIL